MTITRKNFDIIKQAILNDTKTDPAVLLAIQATEAAAVDHNKKMVAYITEKRKDNKNFCR